MATLSRLYAVDSAPLMSPVDPRFWQDYKEKERLASRLQHLISILPSGVVILDAFGRIADCNQIAIELLGQPLLQTRWMDVIQRAFAPKADDGHEVSLKDGRRVRIETRSLDPEPGQLLLLTDLTETRQLQERLGHHQRLQALGKMMASLAHQLRTPLATATLYAEHLIQDSLPLDKRQRFTGKIQQCLQNLTQQINDMLLFARGGDTLAQPLLLDEFLAGFTEQFDNAEVSLSLQGLPSDAELVANPAALQGALNNLVFNSIQAGASELVLRVDWLDEAWLQLSLTDNGPGMTPEVLVRATEPFYTTKMAGTGLGLAVVSAVASAHQGRLELESTSGQGLTVKLIFPARRLVNKEIASC